MKTDNQLKQDVNAELKWEPSIHAAEIGVEVKEGIVTLSGHVSSYTEKLNAERAAQRVVKSEIEAALIRSALADGKNIQVKVNGADVTLTGKVHNHSERDIARLSAWNSPGVQSVVDNMIVTI